jgi:hypothetical protein
VLVESQTTDIPQISQEENKILTSNFIEKEVFEAVMQMEKNKAKRPDGFLTEFYQTFWEIIKIDLMNMFIKFH